MDPWSEELCYIDSFDYMFARVLRIFVSEMKILRLKSLNFISLLNFIKLRVNLCKAS